MSSSDASAPTRRSVAPNTGTATAIFLGAAVGAGLVGGADMLGRLFGFTASAVISWGAVLAGALAWGTHRDVRLPGDSRRSEPRALAIRLIALGVLLAAFAFAGSAGRVVAWVGGGIGVGAVRDAVARLFVGAFLLVPAGVVAGSALRRGARRLPEGDEAAHALAAAVTAMTVAALLARGASLFTAADPQRFAGAIAGVALLLAGVVAWRTPFHVREEAPAAPSELGVFPLLAALTVGFGLAALCFLSARALVPIFGAELPHLPVAEVTTGTGLAVGALLAAALLRRRRGSERMAFATTLIAVAAMLAIALLERRGPLAGTFAASVAKAADLDAVIREAFRIAAPRTAPVALLLGAAAVLLAGSLPSGLPRRTIWLARVASGVALGAVLGTASSRLTLPSLGFETSLRAHALVAAALAAAAAALAPFSRAVRVALVVGLLALTTWLARAVPPTDRVALLIDRQLRATGFLIQGLQKNWIAFDEDDEDVSVAILRRGQAKRLLVDGRFESSNEHTTKTHGMLAQLPLALHSAPKRVLVVGPGTGWAIAVAEAHPVERIDLVATGPAPVRAAGLLGPIPRAAFSDPRLHTHLGDPEDLLARADVYDVILLEPSGGWSERSADLATVESLERVRDRLGEGGLASLWIPNSALTREGFLVLLATWTHVFPRVEAWSGQGGDVLLLANRDDAPHDFAKVLAAYHLPQVAAACEAAWIATPETLLSQFLIGDATVRRISSGREPSTRHNGALSREEAARRHGAPTVDPVPGLAAIRDDVVGTLVGTPGEGFAPAIAIAIRARDLEWRGLDLELDGKPTEAVDAYREAISLNPHDGATRRALATLRSQQGIEYGTRQAFFAAHAYMREAVETDTTYAQGFGNLGLLLAQAENFDYAIACTGQGIELAPDDDLLVLQMGRIWKQRGYFDKALPYYKQALDLNPKNVEAGIGYVDAKLAMEGDAADLRWGVDFLEKFRPLEPDHEDLLYRIGKLNDALSRRAKRAGEAAADSAAADSTAADSTAADSTAADSAAADSAAPATPKPPPSPIDSALTSSPG